MASSQHFMVRNMYNLPRSVFIVLDQYLFISVTCNCLGDNVGFAIMILVDTSMLHEIVGINFWPS